MNIAVCPKATYILFIYDKGRAHDARHQFAVKKRMLLKLICISCAQLLYAAAEYVAARKCNKLYVVSIDGGERINVASIVCIELLLSTLLRSSIVY